MNDKLSVPFIDILFGLAIAQIFMEIAPKPDQIKSAGWAQLALALLIISLSWVGYHVAHRSPR